MTPTEALEIIRKEVVLPRGVSARISPDKKAVLIGTLDLFFAIAGPSLAHDEDFLLSRVKQGLSDLERVRPEYEASKAEQAKAEALVKEQKTKRKK